LGALGVLLAVFGLFAAELIEVPDRGFRFLTFQEGFFEFWYHVTFLYSHLAEAQRGIDYPDGGGGLTVFGWIPTVIYSLLNLVILFTLPLAMVDLLKYAMGRRDGEEKMTDLVRATVTVDAAKPWHAYHVMKHIGSAPQFRLLRVKDRLRALQHLNANYVFRGRFICEVQIRLGDVPPHYHANHFLYELQRAQTTFELLDTLNARAAYLADHRALVRE